MAQGKTLWQGLAQGTLRLLGRLPLSFHHGMARFLGWLMRNVVRYRVDVVRDNLEKSFPEKSATEINQILKKFYNHFGNILTETLWFGSCRGDKGRKRLKDSHIVEISNPEVLNRLFRERKQVMIMQSHAGNWELIGGILNYTYTEPLEINTHTFAITYLPLHNKFWDSFMGENRQAPVADMDFPGYVPSQQIARVVFSNRDKHFCYSFITDQFPYGPNRKYSLRFMNRDTVIMPGAATVAARTDMAVLFLSFQCREYGGYKMTFVPITEHAGSMDPLDITAKYFNLLEEDIKAQPWNYLWTHRRWKKE